MESEPFAKALAWKWLALLGASDSDGHSKGMALREFREYVLQWTRMKKKDKWYEVYGPKNEHEILFSGILLKKPGLKFLMEILTSFFFPMNLPLHRTEEKQGQNSVCTTWWSWGGVRRLWSYLEWDQNKQGITIVVWRKGNASSLSWTFLWGITIVG